MEIVPLATTNIVVLAQTNTLNIWEAIDFSESGPKKKKTKQKEDDFFLRQIIMGSFHSIYSLVLFKIICI